LVNLGDGGCGLGGGEIGHLGGFGIFPQIKIPIYLIIFSLTHGFGIFPFSKKCPFYLMCLSVTSNSPLIARQIFEFLSSG